MGTHLQEIWDKVAGRNTFGEKDPFVKVCNYKVATAALKVIETFVSQI